MARAGIRSYLVDWGTPLDKKWADDGPYWNLRCNGGILSTHSTLVVSPQRS